MVEGESGSGDPRGHRLCEPGGRRAGPGAGVGGGARLGHVAGRALQEAKALRPNPNLFCLEIFRLKAV